MLPTTSVLFYGNSIFLAGLQAELAAADAALRLFTLPTDSPDIVQRIQAYQPQVVFFDLSVAEQPNFVIPLLRQQPGLLLIGLHPSCAEIVILSGQTASAGRITDLLSLIHSTELTP